MDMVPITRISAIRDVPESSGSERRMAKSQRGRRLFLGRREKGWGLDWLLREPADAVDLVHDHPRPSRR
jgi:hypothetical protein